MLDFQKIKADYRIEEVAERLGLTLQKRGNQLRGACPSGKGGERALVITPEKGAWYSFGVQKGGDVIALAAFVNNLTVKAAAEWIVGGVPEEKPEKGRTDAVEARGGFKQLDYLIHDHEAVSAIGIEPEDAERIGCGYAPRGACRGMIAWPVRLPDGTLIGYMGLTEVAWLPKEWRWGD